MNQHVWPTRRLDLLGFSVGWCAWGTSMLIGANLEYIRGRHSLVVIDWAGLDEHQYATVGCALAELRGASREGDSPPAGLFPVMLCIEQPVFARRLPEVVARCMGLLSLTKADVLTIRVDEAQELKGGGVLQQAFKLRDQGVVQHIGLATDDVRGAEWMALHTAVRVLMFPYGLEDEGARYRLLVAAEDSGMTCLTTIAGGGGDDAVRFALGESSKVLPVFDRPLPDGVEAMSPDEIERCWQEYSRAHPEPPPLPRGLPPEA